MVVWLLEMIQALLVKRLGDLRDTWTYVYRPTGQIRVKALNHVFGLGASY